MTKASTTRGAIDLAPYAKVPAMGEYLASRAEHCARRNAEANAFFEETRKRLMKSPLAIFSAPFSAVAFKTADDRERRRGNAAALWGACGIRMLELSYIELLRPGESQITALVEVRCGYVELDRSQAGHGQESSFYEDILAFFDDDLWSWGDACFFRDAADYHAFKRLLLAFREELKPYLF